MKKKRDDEPTIEFELESGDMDRLEGEAKKLGITFEEFVNRIVRDALPKLKKETTKTTKRKTR
jgi:hypothetical protein